MPVFSLITPSVSRTNLEAWREYILELNNRLDDRGGAAKHIISRRAIKYGGGCVAAK